MTGHDTDSVFRPLIWPVCTTALTGIQAQGMNCVLYFECTSPCFLLGLLALDRPHSTGFVCFALLFRVPVPYRGRANALRCHTPPFVGRVVGVGAGVGVSVGVGVFWLVGLGG